jgi:peptide-methionine (S)-S-oxide reductase
MIKFITLLVMNMIVSSCGSRAEELSNENNLMNKIENVEYIVLGGGCFWCVEAVYLNVEGVLNVESGYTGGKTANPTYNEICSGTTGHAEVIKVAYNTDVLGLEDVLQIFFAVHDPTTLNRQGADKGTQYRSSIFYTNEDQKLLAQNFIKLLGEEKVFNDPIVTELSKLGTFYKAEDYHQNYYNQNSNQPYCRMVISPKIEKLKKQFKDKLKK